MHYYQITNPGTKDWITHQDNELAHVTQYGSDIWVTENTAWAARVGATELTKAEAQTVCDAEVTNARVAWETCRTTSEDPESCGLEPQYYTLP